MLDGIAFLGAVRALLNLAEELAILMVLVGRLRVLRIILFSLLLHRGLGLGEVVLRVAAILCLCLRHTRPSRLLHIEDLLLSSGRVIAVTRAPARARQVVGVDVEHVMSFFDNASLDGMGRLYDRVLVLQRHLLLGVLSLRLLLLAVLKDVTERRRGIGYLGLILVADLRQLLDEILWEDRATVEVLVEEALSTELDGLRLARNQCCDSQRGVECKSHPLTYSI